jgi:pimeloyl-ACP methyl ester carboxylesterase
MKVIPSARAVVIDEAGHMAHVDQPRAWLDAVADFLS